MYDKIYDLENLLLAYSLSIKAKRYEEVVVRFSYHLERNLINLNKSLTSEYYLPSAYNHFTIIDPKRRNISAPPFLDRVVQHALVNIIEPIFERSFISDTYACRKDKGTHYALGRLKKFLKANISIYGKEKDIYVLKCDIRKYFQSISWDILLKIISSKISCPKTYKLIEKIITTHEIYRTTGLVSNTEQLDMFKEAIDEPVSIEKRRGLPIGNLTSQLFANVYLNELDQYVKHVLRERWYCRYMDDFLILSSDKKHLKEIKEKIEEFLITKLKLELHKRKSFIHNTKEGVCFVGYRVFHNHVLVRGNTLLRIQKKYKKKIDNYRKGKLSFEKLAQTESSIKGHLIHANSYSLLKHIFKENRLSNTL